MKALPVVIFIASAAISAQALGKKPANQQATQNAVLLKQALTAFAATAKPEDQFNPKVDRDQGDDHANAGAILRVCSKDTPAAHRSAICPVAISPD